MNTTFILSGKLIFENATIRDNLRVNFFNNFNLDNLIPLATPQAIKGRLDIANLAVFNGIFVGNLVNGYRLDVEHSNTVMVS